MTAPAFKTSPRPTAREVLDVLRARGDIWSPTPGFVGFRGATLLLFEAMETLAKSVARDLAPESWQTPAAISFEALERADYFASFPQWLTGLAHLSDDPADLARVAENRSPARIAPRCMKAQATALPPAVCYHTYAALADSTLASPVLMNAQGTCWRHEAAGFQPLARGWAFNMREAVCVGSADAVEDFRGQATQALKGLASRLGLEAEVHPASDPFFSPTPEGQARGKGLVQRIRELKHELQIDMGDRRALAIGSVNQHASFFGEAFDITLPAGDPAHSACLAFGIERWVLAVMLAHGTEPDQWPQAVQVALPQK